MKKLVATVVLTALSFLTIPSANASVKKAAHKAAHAAKKPFHKHSKKGKK